MTTSIWVVVAASVRGLRWRAPVAPALAEPVANEGAGARRARFDDIVLFPVMSFLVANPTAATLVAAVVGLSFLQAMSAAVGVIPILLILPLNRLSRGLAVTYSLAVCDLRRHRATYVATWLVGVTGDPLASAYYVTAATFVMAVAVLFFSDADAGPQVMARRPVEREV